MANDSTTAELQIRGDISPSLHPESIAGHRDVLTGDGAGPGSLAYTNATRALHGLYKSLSDLSEATYAIREPLQPGEKPRAGPPDMPIVNFKIDPQKAAALVTAATQRLTSTAATLAKHRDEIEKSIAALDSRVEATLSNPRRNEASVSQAASEIRAHVKSLPPGERMAFLNAALDASDHEITAAVLSTSPFVSGLDRAQFATLRQLASAHFAPKEFAQANAARGILQHLDNAATVFGQRYQSLIPKATESSSAKAIKRAANG